MDKITLEDIIRANVPLSPSTATGWHACIHQGCDHGAKGPRAAFRFDNGTTSFHCFNCSIKTVYNPINHPNIPTKMVQVLKDFNISDDEINKVIFFAMTESRNTTDFAMASLTKKKTIEPAEIPIPSHFYLLKDAAEEDKWAMVAKDYLENERQIDPASYPFYLSTGGMTDNSKKWKKRIIIPIYKNNKLIYYSGRDLTNKNKKKYLNADYPSNTIIYGFDKLYENPELPLYVLEGWFKAHSIDGVAVFGNTLSEAQIEWLNRSKREKVVIPDKYGDGHILAEQAVELGWKVSFPDIGNCKDIDSAIIKYGKLYVFHSVKENTLEGLQAKLKIGLWCEHDGKNRSKKKDKKPY